MKRIAALFTLLMLLTATACGNIADGAPESKSGTASNTSVSDLVTDPTPSISVSEGDLLAQYASLRLPAQEVEDRFISALAAFSVTLAEKSFTEEGQNHLISPLSALLALGMVETGAKGQTLAELEALTGLSSEELNSQLNSYTSDLDGERTHVYTANSVWMRNTYPISTDYLTRLAAAYDASVYSEPMDDTTLDKMNAWVNAKTQGMIPSIMKEFPEGVDPALYLINALTFTGRWSDTFYTAGKGLFTSADQTEQTVEYLGSDEESRAFQNETGSGFFKSYEEGRYAFFAVLPAQGVTPEAWIAAEGANLFSLRDNADSLARVYLPAFTVEDDLNLQASLKAMGVTDAFSSQRADFSGIGAEPVFINQILQKTFIEVDREGTKAAAATIIDAPTESEPMEPEFTLRFDRPFAFGIVDTRTGIPLFLGCVNEFTS